MLAWSMSRLKKADCMAKFKALYIDKSVTESMSPAGQKGIDDHESLERFVKQNVPLPAHLQPFEPALARLRNFPTLLVEHEFAFTEDWRFVDWFSKEVWCRIKADLIGMREDAALYIDYKTGKEVDDETQIFMTAVATFQKFPHINTFKGRNWWLKTNKIKQPSFDCDGVYHRKHLPLYLKRFHNLPRKIYEAVQNDRYPFEPSADACRFCPLRGSCQYAHGKDRQNYSALGGRTA